MGGRIIFSTDLHGSAAGFKRVLRHASKTGISKVVFGGDINPKRSFMRFKDGVAVADSQFPPSCTMEGLRGRLLEIREENSKGGLAQKGVPDGHYGVSVKIALLEVAEHADWVFRLLFDHTIGAFRHGSALSTDMFSMPDEKRREVLAKAAPAILRQMPRWIARICTDELFMDAYISARGGVRTQRPDLPMVRDIFYRTMPEAIIKAFRAEARKIEKAVLACSRAAYSKPNIERGQLRWLKNSLLPEISLFVKSGSGRQVFIMPGNDDVSRTLDVLEEAEAKGILVQVHGKVVPLSGGFFIGGYSYVPGLLPPLLQDWRRDEAGILCDLRAMFGSSDQGRTILSIHVPPKNGLLDLNFEKKHIGSSGVADYLSESAHPLALVGHVHEIVEKHGFWIERIGDTLVMSPGAAHRNGTDALVFELDNPGNAERIKID